MQAIVAQLPIAIVGRVARASLPYTGIALGAYFGVALTMLVVGFVLRLFSKTRRDS